MEAIRQVLPIQLCLLRNERWEHGSIMLNVIIIVILRARLKYLPGPKRALFSTSWKTGQWIRISLAAQTYVCIVYVLVLFYADKARPTKLSKCFIKYFVNKIYRPEKREVLGSVGLWRHADWPWWRLAFTKYYKFLNNSLYRCLMLLLLFAS